MDAAISHKTTAVRLPAAIDRALADAARRRFTTKSEVIRQALITQLGLSEEGN